MPNSLCGAKTRKGGQCKRSPSAGKKRCRLHGGATPAGVASPHFRHGRYSKVLPMDMRKRYEASKKDQELLTHEPEIRLLDTHLHSLIQQINDAPKQDTLRRAKEIWAEFRQAKADDNTEFMEQCLERVDGVFRAEEPMLQSWGEIREVLEIRRKMLESETRRIKDSQHSMNAEQLLAIIEYLVDVIRKAVNKYADRETAKKILSQITGDIGAMVSGSVPRSAATDRLLA